MPDNLSLIRQLANRAKSFHKITGVTQSQLAAAIGMSDGNYSGFLAGKKGIGSEATCLLLKFTNMSVRQAIATFSKPVPTSRVMELQEQGRHLELENGGWVSGQSEVDPVDSTPINDTPDADVDYNQSTVDVLKGALGIHRQAIRSIKGYLHQIATRAKVNRGDGTTAPNGQRSQPIRSSGLPMEQMMSPPASQLKTS